jgi:hypothetical protein
VKGALDLSGSQVHAVVAARGHCPADAQPEKVENIEPLKGLTALQELDLGATRVESLEPLKGLSALQKLHVPRVESLEPVEDLITLQELYHEGVSQEELTRFNHYRQEKKLPLVAIHP